MDLSVLDLAKNHLFGQAGGETLLRDIQGRWSQMMANLTNVKADDPLWSGYSEEAKERVRNLKLLGGQQVHPVLLSALERFPPGEVERLLRLLEILIVRYQLVGGGRTGRLEISCARLAHQIFERKCANTTEAAGLLKDILPNDDQFREDFRTKEEKNGRKARYLLSFLERQARAAKRGGVAGPELQPSGTLTLEHVFPKSPGEKWRGLQKEDPDFADECTHRLGNLCLLSDVNRALGNEGFDRKKAVFAGSDLLTTREISAFGDWDRAALEKRQAAMAKLAVALWRVDF